MRRGYLKDYSVDSLCDFIRGELKRQKINQAEAAEFIGVTQGRMAQKLKDGTFTVRELKAIRILLNVEKEELSSYL